MTIESSTRLLERDIRRISISQNLIEERAPTAHVGRENYPGTLVVVPMHDDKRLPTAAHMVDSLASQHYQHEVRLIVANNGLSVSAVRDISEICNARGLTVTVTDALPTKKEEQNAGHARNVAVKEIRDAAQTNPSFRRNGVLFMDDDTALLPDGLELLEHTTRDKSGAVATTAKNISVPDINAKTQSKYKSVNGKKQSARQVPTVSNGDCIDVGNLIAFGSDVAIKTCGVYVDYENFSRLDKPFILMPNGSAEDVLLTIGLSRYGAIYTNPNAILLDQARETPAQVRKQRMNWGRDHVHVFNDMERIGRTQNSGITVLEPKDNTWIETIYPPIDGEQNGLIINPQQLKTFGKRLANVLSTEGAESFGLDASMESLFDELSIMFRSLQCIEELRPQKSYVRTDIPAPLDPDIRETRYSENALLGLLLGNLLGNADIREESNNIVYGLRQAAAW